MCGSVRKIDRNEEIPQVEGDMAQGKEGWKQKSEMQPEPEEASLAMVVYNGEILSEVINRIGGLGLKRAVNEEWEAPVPKRSKTERVVSEPKPAVSIYAENLRKTKARIKRNVKRKGKGIKEATAGDDMELEGVGLSPILKTEMTGEFVFRAEPIGSDHHALIIDCCYQETKGNKTFQFEAIWTEHENFLPVVREGWREVEGEVEDKVMDLARRLKACQQKLWAWSKQEFPHFRGVISQLRHKLNDCYKGQMTEETLVAAEDLIRQIEETWRKEESYWWQRSRVSWLTCGDKNTKFFHNVVIQRRLRNKILRLKNDSGEWMEERGDIHKAFSDFYGKLFRTGGTRDMDQALSYVKKVITETDNCLLMAQVG
ncbi:hypothetical protein K1719_018341 [Acacia pycnantha]|nr:hypothetical protein K1719_018341 [Acacia pycnantha]